MLFLISLHTIPHKAGEACLVSIAPQRSDVTLVALQGSVLNRRR